MGVPIMFPNKDPWYLFSNERYRIKTGNYGTEAMCFGGFCLLTSFSYPLMENGFWTTYNTSFGTPKTLFSEFKKSPDLMTAVCVWQVGSDVRTDSGALVSCVSETNFTLWRNDSFIHFDAAKQIIKQVVPQHTKKLFFVETKPFISLDADSLNNLLRGRIILDLDVNCTEPFRYFENGMPTRSLNAKLFFPHKLYFQSLDSLPRKDSLFQETDFPSMAIVNDLRRLDADFAHRNAEFRRHADSINIYADLAKRETNAETKERYQKRRAQLNLEESPQFDFISKTSLEAALVISRARFVVDNRRREFDRERAFLAIVRAKPKTTFTGVVKWVRIE
jgi:inner membrane protein